MIGKDTEKQTKTKTKTEKKIRTTKIGDCCLQQLILYATMSVFERRIHLSKSDTHIVSIQVE